MSEDAKELHTLINKRKSLLTEMEEKLKKKRNQTLSSLSEIRARHSNIRQAKNEAKEQERKALSRTMMAKLVSSSDYPECPPYVPDIINVLKNILGKKLTVGRRYRNCSVVIIRHIFLNRWGHDNSWRQQRHK